MSQTTSIEVRSERLAGAAVVLPAMYAGLLLGCSILATSAKFLAPSLTLPVALDVGRHTFGVLHGIELFIAPLLVVVLWAERGAGRLTAAAMIVVGMLLAEVLWLRPVLDERVTAIMQETDVPPSWHHWGFGAAELAKVMLLSWLSWAGIGHLRSRVC